MLSYISVISWISYLYFHDLVPRVGFDLAYDAKGEINYEVAAQLFFVVIIFHGLFLLVFMTVIKSI